MFLEPGFRPVLLTHTHSENSLGFAKTDLKQTGKVDLNTNRQCHLVPCTAAPCISSQTDEVGTSKANLGTRDLRRICVTLKSILPPPPSPRKAKFTAGNFSLYRQQNLTFSCFPSTGQQLYCLWEPNTTAATSISPKHPQTLCCRSVQLSERCMRIQCSG